MQRKPTNKYCAKHVSQSVVTAADADPEEERFKALDV